MRHNLIGRRAQDPVTRLRALEPMNLPGVAVEACVHRVLAASLERAAAEGWGSVACVKCGDLLVLRWS